MRYGTRGWTPSRGCLDRAGTRARNVDEIVRRRNHPTHGHDGDLTIAGTWCFHVYDWPRIAAMIERGTFPVERIVTSRVGLEETVPGGFEVLVDPRGSEVKVLVEVG